MKKISYVLLAAATFASCFSCKKDIHMVSEEEFNKAITFEGIEYMQISGVGKHGSSSSTEEFSPTVYHYYNVYDGGYVENYITKIDDSHFKGIERNSYETHDVWKEMTPEEAASSFEIPADFSEEIKVYIDAVGGFSKFKYDDETKKYSVAGQYEEHDYHIILAFENVHLMSCDITIGDPAVYNFTYEEKTPVVPTPSQVL